MTQTVVDDWIEVVEKVFKDKGLAELTNDTVASRLRNAGLCWDATSTRVLAGKGTKSGYKIGGGSRREYITVHGCGSADEIRLPPFVVY